MVKSIQDNVLIKQNFSLFFLNFELTKNISSLYHKMTDMTKYIISFQPWNFATCCCVCWLKSNSIIKVLAAFSFSFTFAKITLRIHQRKNRKSFSCCEIVRKLYFLVEHECEFVSGYYVRFKMGIFKGGWITKFHDDCSSKYKTIKLRIVKNYIQVL